MAQSKNVVYRQMRGALEHAQGQQFETRLNAAFDFYRDRGLADIQKTPEAMRVVKNLGNGKFVAVFEKKAQADYSGVLANGRAVAMEAKSTKADRIEQGRVTKEQGDFLELRQSMGAVCFVLAGFSSGNVYRLPWVVWRDMKDIFSRKSVTEEDLAEFRVPRQGLCPLVLDGLV